MLICPYDFIRTNFCYFQYTAVITNDMSNLSSAVDLSSFVVLTPGIKSGLEGLRNSGLSDINFTQINNVVSPSDI